ncbi:MAG TPA: Fe-S cluster assembly protein SufD [Caulobacteraceae bacterium]|jgi:Fe-S cluster assembly protein SufD|nr:Fe-S cluster assembly protein SufD [Caulobacteraceae bacterium]
MSLASALKTGDVAELPSRRDEDWRWSDLRGLIRTLPPASPPGDAARLGQGPFGALADEAVVFLNGRRVSGDAKVTVEAGAPRVIALRFISQAVETAHHSAFNLTLAPGASAVLLESHEGSGESYIADAAVDIRLGEGARLERIVLVEEAPDAVAVSTTEVNLAPGADLAQTVLTAGAKRQRHETRVRHGGGQARLRLDGAYLLDGPRHADLTTEVIHTAPGGATRQLTKGAVRGASRAVFQGRIVVREGADGTDARMGCHALILSERAEVDAKPELEIYADDVACAHGNTVGALDEEALFYARSRGIPEPEARAMLTEAFVGEVVDRIEHEGARDIVRDWVANRLRGEP